MKYSVQATSPDLANIKTWTASKKDGTNAWDESREQDKAHANDARCLTAVVTYLRLLLALACGRRYYA